MPAGLPAGAEPMVHDSIGKAIEAIVTFRLPADVARTVHDAASDAFFRGMQVAAWVGTGVVLCAAIIAYRYLPARADRAVSEDPELAVDAKEMAALDDGIYT